MIDHKFNFGDVVYLITDFDQYKHIVTGILSLQGGVHKYQLCCCDAISYHYEFELSVDPQEVGE